MPLVSAFTDSAVSGNIDFPMIADSSITKADVPLSSEEQLIQSAEGTKSSLHPAIYSLPDGLHADPLCRDPSLPILESVPRDELQSSCLVESGCGQNEKDGNSFALITTSRMKAGNNNDGLHCRGLDQSGESDLGAQVEDMECEYIVTGNDNLPSASDCLQLCVESPDTGVIAQSNMPRISSCVGFSGACSILASTVEFNLVPALNVTSKENVIVGDRKSGEHLLMQVSSSSRSGSQSNFMKSKPAISTEASDQPNSQKTVSVSSKNANNKFSSYAMSRQLNRRNVLIRADTPVSSGPALPVIAPLKKALPIYSAKPRTWSRADNLPAFDTHPKKPIVGAVPPQRPPSGKTIKVQGSSYIRKGNSLVRNPAAKSATVGSRVAGASVRLWKLDDSNRAKVTITAQRRVESTIVSDCVIGRQNTTVEMPKTPPLSCSGTTSECEAVHSESCRSSPVLSQSERMDNVGVTRLSMTASYSCENPETRLDRNLEDSGALSDGNFPSSYPNRVVYIKRKSNQLIAASNPAKPSTHKMDGAPAVSSDTNYYKRRKNQLIRASSESNIQHMVAVIDDGSDLQPQRAPQRSLNVYSNRNTTRRHSGKVKSRKLSLVWKLGETKSPGKGVDALRCQKILSHLLPWKRATYWRSLWQISSNFSSGSLLTKTRKLLPSRKRAAVYVRSGRGFSLRRSKVISLSGSSLKWSKSMEKRSKKVNEEASHAVTTLGSPGRPKTGERIFRIGLFRYRMDPSRRTLQRISDEDPSESIASRPERDVRKAYVPKRLLIGSDEYIRIGNGNKLVRDPKRRTRILASEKVRWSLHTARMKLAKKRKFCQFFTRFGKCNKGEGKCPFAHDSSKIAVCTRFLNGLCGDPKCKLTHKVIPERMPDCSFFLQGLCSNEHCPYRHVNVNPKASVCGSFLRGYCAEGNECRKKHSYSCPEFEASGSCPQGSKCKLYHPKKGKDKKRKISKVQRIVWGRYFGSGVKIAHEPEADVAEHILPASGSSGFQGEDLGDFIGLDASDDEAGVIYEPLSEPTASSEGEDSNSKVDDLDEQIKPLHILNNNL